MSVEVVLESFFPALLRVLLAGPVLFAACCCVCAEEIGGLLMMCPLRLKSVSSSTIIWIPIDRLDLTIAVRK